MAIAQGISKQVAVLKQAGGLAVYTPVTGSQIMRRESSVNSLKIASYDNNELVSHQQSTGKTHGLRSVDSSINGVLSPKTYSALIGSVLRKDFVVSTPITAAAIIFGGVLGAYTLAGTGLLVSGGFKIGDIIRVTAGTALPTDIINKNLIITNITALVITVKTLNNSTITVNAVAVAACTIALAGKKTWVPDALQTKDYYMVEDWQSDINQSELFKDIIFGKMDVSLSSSGNATINFSGSGLDRTPSATRQLTSPTVETSTNPLAAINGVLIVNNVAVVNVTGLSLSVDGKVAAMGAVIGANIAPDIQRGSVDVTGSFTALYQDSTLSAIFEAGTPVGLVVVIEDTGSASSDFVSFSMSSVTLDSDGKDDGEKAIVRTYSFTARINAGGGASLASDHTIISIQDSAAA